MKIPYISKIREEAYETCETIKHRFKKEGEGIFMSLVNEFAPVFAENYQLSRIGTGVIIDDLRIEARKESRLEKN